MSLRLRLALTLVAVSIPLVAGAQWLRGDIERRAAVTGLAAFARLRMETGGRDQCERSPETFRDPPRSPQRMPPRGDERDAAPEQLVPDAPQALALRGPAVATDPPDGGSSRPPEPPSVASSLQELSADPSAPARSSAEDVRSDPHESPQGGTARGRRGERAHAERDAPPHGERAGPPRGDRGEPGERRGPSRPRVEMFAYGADFVSANPAAPPFPADLRRALESGEAESGDVGDVGDRREVTAAVRMNWTSGPCAIMLAWRHDEKPALQSLDEIGFAAIVAAGLVIAVLVAIGPIERRMRRLTSDVQRSAADHYRQAVPVGGSDEIGALARAFNAAGSEVRTYIEELEKRERSLRDFVQNTTHDVMLPLTVLQGHLTQVRDVLASGGVPDRKTVRDALEESHYLASLVQNLVAAARLESGPPQRRHDAFNWNQLVERVVQRHGPIAREKGVELDFAAPENEVRAEGDVTLVEQALSNVVHNAVRYNKSGGHVAVLLDALADRFSVRVFDDGPGVDESELARIAERSFRSDEARARHPDGMGLGLTIAKDVADRHGFTLVLRRAEAGGLEVEIGGPALPA